MRFAQFVMWADNDPTFNETGNFTWTFTDAGQPRTLYGRDPNFSFATPGYHLVTLTVRDASGNTASFSLPFDVVPTAASAALNLAVVFLLVGAAAVALSVLLTGRRSARKPRERADKNRHQDEGEDKRKDD